MSATSESLTLNKSHMNQALIQPFDGPREQSLLACSAHNWVPIAKKPVWPLTFVDKGHRPRPAPLCAAKVQYCNYETHIIQKLLLHFEIGSLKAN